MAEKLLIDNIAPAVEDMMEKIKSMKAHEFTLTIRMEAGGVPEYELEVEGVCV